MWGKVNKFGTKTERFKKYIFAIQGGKKWANNPVSECRRKTRVPSGESHTESDKIRRNY
jgi:hypothetical protein